MKNFVPFIPKYPELPITEKLDLIRQTLLLHPVVILEGETGSGKSTQIPKICLELGFSNQGLIACTQPRRIAATSICNRLREELEDDSLVGSKIRFYEDLPENMQIQVMTDGVLLQEFRNDPFLRKYSCIILDEAHERSLNMDLLLGIFKILRQRRPDLKFVITSATMDAELFAAFFEGAPIIRVEGRTFPVQIHYADAVDELNLDEKVVGAILTLMDDKPDHLLCFLPTERDILETQQLLLSQTDRFEVLPLFARMPAAEQKKVFAPSTKPKVILSTNVAETSLTIPGIAYVVDSGLARVLRYQPQNRIQALPIERISKASAGQRAGRAGRVKPGVCIRLYSEEDFAERVDYTDPEILRSSLDNVVLQLRQLRLDPEQFPFVQSPSRSALRSASSHLWEIGALSEPTPQGELTSMGRRMVKLPMDALLSRILIQAFDQQMVLPVGVICAALSLSEVRIFPQDPEEKLRAERAHQIFKGPGSDFYLWLRIWNLFWAEGKLKASRNRMRQFCKKHFLSFQRLSEWIDLFEQFMRLLKVNLDSYEMDLDNLNEDLLHQCLLSGLIAGVSKKDPQSHLYRLSGGKEAVVVASSTLYKKKPEWVLSAQIRETGRIYMGANCEIKPTWIYKQFPYLCKKSYHDPLYNPQTGFVEAKEEVRFRTFVLTQSRRVQYHSIEPELCAQIFFADGVVANQLPRKVSIVEQNTQFLRQLKKIEQSLRIRNLAPEVEEVVQWYLAKCTQVRHFKELQDWLKIHGEEALCLDWQSLGAEKAHTKLQGLLLAQEELPQLLKRLLPNTLPILKQKALVKSVQELGSPLDGIQIQVSKSLWWQISAADWALKIPLWREWIWQKVVSANNKETQEFLQSEALLLKDNWTKRLSKNPLQSPLLNLWEVLKDHLQSKGLRFQVPKSWEAFETLHLLDGTAVYHLSPIVSTPLLLQELSHIYYRREHRGKMDLLDYDRICLGQGDFWRTPVLAKQGIELRDFRSKDEAFYQLHLLKNSAPLRKFYPKAVLQVESWIQSIMHPLCVWAKVDKSQIFALQENAAFAFILSLPETHRAEIADLAKWKTDFRLPRLQSPSKIQGKGLEQLASLQTKQSQEKAWIAMMMIQALSLGPPALDFWKSALQALENQKPTMTILLSSIKSDLDRISPAQNPALSFALLSAAVGDVQEQEEVLGRYFEMQKNEGKWLKTLRKRREDYRSHFLVFDEFKEEKQQLQTRLTDMEKQGYLGSALAEQEVLIVADQLELKALQKGVDLGEDSSPVLHSSPKMQNQSHVAVDLSRLAELKSKFGKI